MFTRYLINYNNVMALTGNVIKWFNRKGYGFINVKTSDSEHIGNDLFVHLSGIRVSNDGYKSLYPGEYVSFDLDTGADGRTNCINVTGGLGGPLLVEHPDYRYKYFQKNPNSRRNGNTIENTVNETVEVKDNNDEEERVEVIEMIADKIDQKNKILLETMKKERETERAENREHFKISN